MIALIRLFLAVATSLMASRARLAAENVALRQQLIMLRRKLPGRVRLRNSDRVFFVWLFRLFPSTLKTIALIRPETLLRWHRAGFRRYWRWKSRLPIGRRPIAAELRSLIREMNADNPLWGAPRIPGELLKLGFDVAQSTVAKCMRKRRGPPSQGWRTFLRNHAPDIAAVDLFVLPTISFSLLYGLVIVGLGRRQLMCVNVTAHPTAEWIARQVTEAFRWATAPRHLIRDRDGAFGNAFFKRLDAMGIRDHPIAPRSPWQNCYVERLIGSIRRDCLDHVVVMGESQLRRILRNYAEYYNRARTHRSLGKDCPLHRPVQATGPILSSPVLGGLHHIYSRM
jgi:hypothetical protein